jgi:hypothetical protein
LVPGGRLALADLDLEGGRFHADKLGVFHSGFDRAALAQIVATAGFDQVRTETAAEVVKPDDQGEMRGFTVFLLTGQVHTYSFPEK